MAVTAAWLAPRAIVTYEHGQTPCTAVLDRLAQAGGVTAEWLQNGTAAERGSAARHDQAWQEAVDLLRQVWQDPYRRGAVVSVLKVLRPP